MPVLLRITPAIMSRAPARICPGMWISSAPPSLRHHLYLAGALQGEHHEEGIGDGTAAGEQAVVGQDQEVAGPQVGLQAGLFLMVQGDALVGVVGQAGEHEQRLLRQRQQALLLAGHRDPRGGMGVQHALDVVANLVHRAMDGVAGRVDLVGAVHQLLAAGIHLHQAGGGDLVEHQAERVDQEVLGARHLGRDVGEDQVVPTVQGDQPVAGSEIDAGLPFGGGDLGLHIGGQGVNGGHGGILFVVIGCPQSSPALLRRLSPGLHSRAG